MKQNICDHLPGIHRWSY